MNITALSKFWTPCCPRDPDTWILTKLLVSFGKIEDDTIQYLTSRIWNAGSTSEHPFDTRTLVLQCIITPSTSPSYIHPLCHCYCRRRSPPHPHQVVETPWRVANTSGNVAVNFILYFSTSSIVLTSLYYLQVDSARLVNVSRPQFEVSRHVQAASSTVKKKYSLCLWDAIFKIFLAGVACVAWVYPCMMLMLNCTNKWFFFEWICDCALQYTLGFCAVCGDIGLAWIQSSALPTFIV